jgi:hypothetical protein
MLSTDAASVGAVIRVRTPADTCVTMLAVLSSLANGHIVLETYALCITSSRATRPPIVLVAITPAPTYTKRVYGCGDLWSTTQGMDGADDGESY